MTLREILVERIAPSRQYCDRTVELYESSLDRFRDFLGHDPTLDDLSDATVGKWLKWRAVTPHGKRRPVRPASVAKDSTQVKSIWTYCAKKRLKRSDGNDIEFPDYRNPVVPMPVPKAFTADELAQILAAARHRRGRISGKPAAWYWMTKVRALYQTGERIGAVLELRWREVDLARHTLTFLAHTRKGRRETLTQPITPRLCELLAPQQEAPGERVWPWLDARAKLSLYGSWRLLLQSAKVPYKPFHSIRKSTASYLKLGGVSAKKQLGHATDGIAEMHYYDEEIVGRANNLSVLPDIEPGVAN